MASITHEEFSAIMNDIFFKADFIDEGKDFDKGYKAAASEIYSRVLNKMLKNAEEELAAARAQNLYEASLKTLYTKT